jgi:hypothetical protein
MFRLYIPCTELNPLLLADKQKSLSLYGPEVLNMVSAKGNAQCSNNDSQIQLKGSSEKCFNFILVESTTVCPGPVRSRDLALVWVQSLGTGATPGSGQPLARRPSPSKPPCKRRFAAPLQSPARHRLSFPGRGRRKSPH